MDIDNLPPLREVIAAHGLRAEKALGQNFLLDQNITDKIVRDSGDLKSLSVVEIGPGPGGLTRSILRAGAKRVVAVEFDERAVRALEDLKQASGGLLDIVKADALETNEKTLSEAPRAIISNLPYNIATPLLIGWLRQIYEDPNSFAWMALMFQKEVAQRICAAPGSKTYGRLAVLVQWLVQARRIYDLPPSAFVPPPKVHSSVVHFMPRARTGEQPRFETVEMMTAAAFGQRRKMIRSSMKDYLPAIETLGIDPTLRAEQLTLDQFLALATESERD